jgi:hypothetical protein
MRDNLRVRSKPEFNVREGDNKPARRPETLMAWMTLKTRKGAEKSLGAKSVPQQRLFLLLSLDFDQMRI